MGLEFLQAVSDGKSGTEICSRKKWLIRTLSNFGQVILVLPERFELSTSPLPRECSTPELRQP
jgi:hypothetical protein